MPERIARKADPEKMFLAAEAFHAIRVTAQRTALHMGNPTILQLTLGTVMAFASETYLKCLRMLECGEFLSGHDLKQLFEDLPEKMRLDIETRHAAEEADPLPATLGQFKELREAGLPTDLQSLLVKGRNFFNRCRYAYEGIATEDSMWGLDVFTLIVKELILERRPEWEAILLNWMRLPRR